MSGIGYTLFPTPLGACAMAWSALGICALQLPEGSAAACAARLQRRFPEALRQRPPEPRAQAIALIQRLLRGAATDLAVLQLDYSGVSDFDRRVYEAARAIPAGATRSYGELAARIGAPRAARAVGAALGRNPFALIVPCHRVLGARGRAGGFSAHGGVRTKLQLLAIEGARPQLELGLR